jgi:1-acyl-sn-glycerol-3-phosphate acyltransferase
MYDDIRPFRDDEVKQVLNRVIEDPEFINSVSAYAFPKAYSLLPGLCRLVTKSSIHWKVRKIDKVKALQTEIEKYMHKLIKRSTSGFTHSGLEDLDLSKPCLFISNHRDITLDPALVNIALYRHGVDTVEIAIGDNLLTKQWISDLMRLNKSFIVKRSEPTKRAMLTASKNLSSYIHHTMHDNQQHVWIAQREGRAKDGIDKTNAAVISMLLLNRPKTTSVADYVAELNIVPVALSYEYDPCDRDKAIELSHIEETGQYNKSENEDVRSITQGILGEKGSIHVAFGEPLSGDFADSKAVAAAIDQQITALYKIHPTNEMAAQWVDENIERKAIGSNLLLDRLEGLSDLQADYLIKMYANPVFAKRTLSQE